MNDGGGGLAPPCTAACDEYCDNSRIYIEGLHPSVTENDLQEVFQSIGIIARIKQKGGCVNLLVMDS